jgi:hypothetical protein
MRPLEYAKNAKDGGWLAFEMLKNGGIIPGNGQKIELELKQQLEPDPENEQAAIKRIAKAIVAGQSRSIDFSAFRFRKLTRRNSLFLRRRKAEEMALGRNSRLS